MTVTTDAHAACVGAHRGEDEVIIIGTGTVAWAMLVGRHHRVGGWGFPGFRRGQRCIGCEVVRRVLWAHDGRVPWTGLLRGAFEQFNCDPHAIVRWMSSAKPRKLQHLAPLVVQNARQRDPVGCETVRLAAGHIDVLVEQLGAIGVQRLALAGGLSSSIAPWLCWEAQHRLVPAAADALAGALWLARVEAGSAALAS